MKIKITLLDGESFPRGLARMSLLSPCPKCGNKFLGNYEPWYPVWSDAESNLVCKECWVAQDNT